MSTNPAVRCENGDPFQLLVSRINDMIILGAESMINFVINGINRVLRKIPFVPSIPKVCFRTGSDRDRCKGGSPTKEELAKLSRCEDSSYGLEELCYYARVSQICSSDAMLSEYNELFAQGYKTVDDVQGELAEAFGESFQMIDPTMAELLRQVEISTFSRPDLDKRKDICSSAHFASAMSLDMVSFE
jgi:hypothetical protein